MLQIGQNTREHGFDEPLGLLSDCHRRIERFLGVLTKVAREFQGSALSPEAVDALARARCYFAEAAPRHTADEEESLFPRMRAAAVARGRACDVIAHLEADHRRAHELQEATDRLFDRWLAEGSLDAGSAADLVGGIEQLGALYREHIREEDTVVFPLAAGLLDAGELARVGEEMRDRRGLSKRVGLL